MSRSPAGPRAAAIDWVKQHALPMWDDRGWDPLQGGFVERLEPSGRPDRAAPRRVRVQARQVYVYAHAAALGWYAPARGVALRGFEWLLERCRREGGGPGFVHVVAGDGSVIDGRIDAYDQAFGLLALAWMFRLTGDAQIRAMIDTEIAFQDEQIADPVHGGWREGIPATLPRRQNPQMHAFEAMLALYEATGDASFLRRAAALLALLNGRLFDRESGSLGEYFDDAMTPLADAEQVVEPGHHFEWTWLLLAYARLNGTEPPPLALPLYDWARKSGMGANGLALDEVTRNGTPRKSTSRLWPQTEFIKANLALEEHKLVPEAGRRADEALARLSRTYLAVEPAGGWVDCLDEQGGVVDGRMPASTFYHLFCAVAEAARVG